MWRKAIIINISLFGFFLSSAQIKYNSPYSSLGLGDQLNTGFAVNKGMAGLGLSNANPYFINNVNPALLPGSKNSIFEFGLRFVSHRLRTDDSFQSSGDGQIDYFALAFPLSKRAAWSFGLQPYSEVNYNTTIGGQTLDGEEGVVENYTGSGGLTKLFWSQGYTVLNKDQKTDTIRKHTQINLGLESSFLFGTINRSQTAQLINNEILDESTLNILKREKYRDLRFKFGTTLRRSINTKQKELVVKNDSVSYYVKKKKFSGIYGNLGLTYELESDVRTQTVEEIQNLNEAGTIITSDTLEITSFDQKLPQIIGLGFSLDRTDPKGKNKKGKRRTALWTLGADAYLTSFPVSSKTKSYQEGTGYRIIVGGEYASDLYRRNKEKTSVFNRYILKAGFRYEILPYTLDDKDVRELGISFGISSPLGPLSSNTLSNQAKFVNLAVQYINRTTEGSNLVDNIWLVNISFTLNHKWFERRKFGL